MEKHIETYSINQLIAKKDLEITKLKAAIEFDLDFEDDLPSDRAVETLKLLVEQRARLKKAAQLIENPDLMIEPEITGEPILNREFNRTSKNTNLRKVIVCAVIMITFGPGIFVYFKQKAAMQASSQVNVRAAEQMAQPAPDPVREAIREMETVSAPSVTLRFGDVFNDLELSEAGKKRIKSAVLVFANALSAANDSTQIPKEFSIRVHHSPTFREKFTDPNSRTSQSYQNKLRSTQIRAANIFDYIFGEEIGEYPNKTLLQSITKAKGMSFESPVMVAPGAALDKVCGKVDCAASRRVELSF